MESKFVPKIVKSNLRGVLLSKLDGVPVTNLLREYRMVTNEDLDYKGMGFTHLIEFLGAVPDVARMVNCPDKIKRVVGIALNNLNITANKSCYKLQNDAKCSTHLAHSANTMNLQTSNKPQSYFNHREMPHSYPTDPNQPYDFRAAFLKDRCPEYQVLKFDPNYNSNTKNDIRREHEQHIQQQHSLHLDQLKHRQVQQQQQQMQQAKLKAQQGQTINNEVQRPVQLYQRPLNGVGIVDHIGDLKTSKPEENKPHAANVPRAMMLCRLQQMINEICPGGMLPRRCNFPSVVDIMLTHVEPQHKNFFWGIIIKPYDSAIDEVLNIDVHKNKFQTFQGGKRAVMFFQRYFCRVWMKSIQEGTASVFMVDFGNTEQVSAKKLMTPPNNVWNCSPIAIPFRHDASKKFDIENHVNERYRCWLTKKEGCIFEVEDVNLV